MSNSSDASLGSIRLSAQEEADLENNDSVPVQTWNQFITNSYKELYDMLTAAYGNDYYVALPYQFVTTGSQSYPFPDGSSNFSSVGGGVAPKFYKLLGVDLQYSASPSGWATLKRFEMIERNKFAYPNTQSAYNGYTNLRYRVQGNNLYVVPTPMTGQTVQLWYAPAPTSLQYRLPGGLTAGSGALTLSDLTGLSVGMSIAGNGVPAGATVGVIGTTSIVMTASASATLSTTASIWSDSTLIDGISGWEEYVIVDSALKALGKQEQDQGPLYQRKLDLKTRIESMAEGRDIGQAFHVSDVLGATAWSVDGFGGSGFGDGWG